MFLLQDLTTVGIKTQRFALARLNGLPGDNGPNVGGMMAWEVVDVQEDGTGYVGFLSLQALALEAAKYAWQLNAKGSSFVSTTYLANGEIRVLMLH